LRREHEGLTVVGDDAQAIYGFRAASPEHILRFDSDFPDGSMVTLTRNYRSTQPILDLANEVWADAARSYPKLLRAERDSGLAPQLVHSLDHAQQAIEVCTRVLALYEQGVPLQEQAVLMRTGSHSSELELELARRNIPFVKYGGIGYLEAAHIKDFTCALRIADNPQDQLSWFRVLGRIPGVGPVTARRVLDALDLDTLTEHALADRWWRDAEPLLKPPSAKACAPLIRALNRANKQFPVAELVGQIRDAITPLIKAHYPDGLTRLRDLDVLTNAAAQAATLDAFLAELALDPPSSSAEYARDPELDDDFLVLSTVHSAKGLEWDAVHIISAGDGLFPSDMALGSPDGLEEERRLFYVALTRARRNLTVHVPVRYYHQPNSRTDTHGYGKQSRFLSERAEALCEIVHASRNPGSGPLAASTTTETVTVDLADLWR
jgi:DNA helicase-2/ATP-dependent DNA helicase PcrA